MEDTFFCFLSTLPRATIQGALGQVPVTQHFVQDFIFVAARLYIFFMSIFGMILLNFFGPRLCVATCKRPAWGIDEEKKTSETDESQVEGGDHELDSDEMLK